MSYQIIDCHLVSVAQEAPIELMELRSAFEEAVSRMYYRIK